MDSPHDAECYIRIQANHRGDPPRIEVRGSTPDLAQLLASVLRESRFHGPLIDAFILLGGPRVLNPLCELGQVVSRSPSSSGAYDPSSTPPVDLPSANRVPDWSAA